MVQDQALPAEDQGQETLDLAPQNTTSPASSLDIVDSPASLLRTRPDDEAGEYEHPFIINLDGINYPCATWETVEAARYLDKRYEEGFNGGMGAFLDSQAVRPGMIYTCVNIDPSTFPYIRMRQAERAQTTLTLTGGETNRPAYGFVAEDSAYTEYLYILNGDRSFKIDLGTSGTGTPALESTTQPTGFASGIAGRPVRFKGAWYAPLGGAVNARKLTATAIGNQSGDTWADVGVPALHFAKMMNEGVAQIWRAHTTNRIDGSADGTTFGDDFEVGDTSFPITDLLSVSGELFVSKPDRPWRFDSQGNSTPIMEFVGSTADYLTNSRPHQGANSGAHGPYSYWCHPSGLWRIIGDSATPIDPFSQRDWSGIGLDGLTPSFNTGWFSFAAWGRWAYATNASDGLYVGWINNDGTVVWLGCMLSGQGSAWDVRARCGICTTSSNPILWLMDDAERFAVFDLETDGSIRGIKTAGAPTSARGGDAEQGQVWLPNTDLGEPEKRKQLRTFWLTVDNNAYTNLEIEARVHRDRNSSSVQLGGDLTSDSKDGRFEFSPSTNTATILTSSVANPTLITTSAAHGFASGDLVTIAGHAGSTPELNGEYEITVQSATTFTIPVSVSVAGSGGTAAGKRDAFIEAMPAIRFDTTTHSTIVGPATDIAFVDGGAGADTITQIAAGFGLFAAGDRITVSGSVSNNGNFTIVSVVAGTITLATGTLTTEAAGASVTITRIFNALTADPRIRTVGIRAATPHVYRAQIPLDAAGLRSYSLGVKDALEKLRDLKSGKGILVREPGYNATFRGYVVDVQERAEAKPGGVQYLAEVYIQRWLL